MVDAAAFIPACDVLAKEQGYVKDTVEHRKAGVQGIFPAWLLKQSWSSEGFRLPFGKSYPL